MYHACEGDCRDGAICPLPTKKVRVVAKNGYDWGNFWYCEEAVAEDVRRGFTVTPVDASEMP